MFHPDMIYRFLPALCKGLIIFSKHVMMLKPALGTSWVRRLRCGHAPNFSKSLCEKQNRGHAPGMSASLGALQPGTASITPGPQCMSPFAVLWGVVCELQGWE